MARWFFRSEQEWLALCEKLKQTPCPHCRARGTLNRHGSLSGYDETSPRRKTLRARRVFCSNRNARPGCGKTFSIWLAEKIRRASLSTVGLYEFLKLVVGQGVAAAVRGLAYHLSDRTLQRIWSRFHHGQSRIRTALFGRCTPPPLPAESPRSPAAEVLTHLQAAFPDAGCPIAAFQQATRTFFL